MSYVSPIYMATATQIEQFENDVGEAVIKTVRRVGVDVDKEELLRALKYDREQYERGYVDGKSFGYDQGYKDGLLSVEATEGGAVRKEMAEWFVDFLTAKGEDDHYYRGSDFFKMARYIKERFELEVPDEVCDD